VSVNFFEDGLVKDESVNGSNLVSFGYDKDGLLTTAGSMTLARNASMGFLETASLGSLSTARTRDDFGELASESTGTHYTVQYPSRASADTSNPANGGRLKTGQRAGAGTRVF
jgi:hypothetical protein